MRLFFRHGGSKMALHIDTNLSGNLPLQKLSGSAKAERSGSLDQLSSGTMIDRAQAEANAAVEFERSENRLPGIESAVRSVSDGVSLLRTARDAIDLGVDLLEQARDALLGAGAGEKDVEGLQNIIDEFGRIAETTVFNGLPLLNGDLQAQSLQVGAGAEETEEVSIESLSPQALGLSGANVDVGTLDAALQQLESTRTTLNSLLERMEGTVDNLAALGENIAASQTSLTEADFASRVGEVLQNLITSDSGTATLAQANVSAQSAMALLQV